MKLALLRLDANLICHRSSVQNLREASASLVFSMVPSLIQLNFLLFEYMFSHSRQIDAIEQTVTGRLCASARVCLLESRANRNQRGFTLVELIMTMVIIGILAVAVAPRFLGVSVFQSRGFADQVQASLRYAQKEAIAQHQFVCVAFTGNSVTLSIGTTAACGTPLLSPTGGPYAITAPAGITFAAVPTSFSFNALGQPIPNPPPIYISGATNAITIEAETGYVHSP